MAMLCLCNNPCILGFVWGLQKDYQVSFDNYQSLIAIQKKFFEVPEKCERQFNKVWLLNRSETGGFKTEAKKQIGFPVSSSVS